MSSVPAQRHSGTTRSDRDAVTNVASTADAPQDGAAGAETEAGGRRLAELDRADALFLLSTVSLGRIVFTHKALPAIRPVNHLVDGQDVIIRSHLGAAVINAATDAVVVAYEADTIDPVLHIGWSVIVTGHASLVIDPAEVRRYVCELRTWVDRPEMDQVIRIEAELVTGFRLIPAGTQSGTGRLA
jgi:Pyridoxamine 5'-phosphate oxidase